MGDSRRPILIEDLAEFRRAGAPKFSPDGSYLVFPVAKPNLETNKNETHLYRLPVGGGEPVRLTSQGTVNNDPAFSPDGRHIAFTSNRSGEPQIWLLPTDGGEARQVTRRKLGMRRPVWFPDGRRLLAVSSVYPDASDDAVIAAREKVREESGTKERVIDRLFFRHWDSWIDGKLEHLFAVDVETGADVDLTPGPYPVPPLALSGEPEYAVSPDGNEVVFVSLREDAQAWSTNCNLWTIPATGGEPRRVSPGPGVNVFPAYSPDGRSIAYCAMRRAGYEADRLDLVILDRASGAVRAAAPGFDRSAGAPAWSPDGSWIVFAAQDRGTSRLYRVAAAGGTPEPITGGASDAAPAIAPDGRRVAFARQSFVHPPDIFTVAATGGDPERMTELNRERLAGMELQDGEDFTYEGAKGAAVHGYLIKPPRFDPAKRYPTVFVIHGGPQSAFLRDFSERWNPQMFAAPGFVVVLINPRGSTGYGQEFTDAIRGEWGGACYEDLTRGFDHVLASFPFCDPAQTAAIGASFGGFMVNWIAGHTDRFRCLLSHDGIFNTEMMSWNTEELWFTEWEFGGLPWEAPEEYRKYSPHLHVRNMKTPMLIVHGEQDFRCISAEGLGLFTALQRMGVKSKLLYLPDEGHWVLKPKNRRTWYTTVLGWLREHLEG